MHVPSKRWPSSLVRCDKCATQVLSLHDHLFFWLSITSLSSILQPQARQPTMETSSPSPIFLRFLHLPAELRLRIWHDVLSERDVPALFSYKKRCWRTVKSVDDEHTARYQNPDLNHFRQKEFRHNLLDPVQVRIPLASVNHEARLISIDWAKKHEIE